MWVITDLKEVLLAVVRVTVGKLSLLHEDCWVEFLAVLFPVELQEVDPEAVRG